MRPNGSRGRLPRAAALAFVGVAFVLAGCPSESTPDASVRDAEPAPDAEPAEAGSPDVPPPVDSGMLLSHDGGGPIACNSTCNCPAGLGCVSGICRSLGQPVWCCSNPSCPAGEACLDTNERPGTCEGVPDVPDAGPRPDAGPGRVGAACGADNECDVALGYTCWERNEAPGMWGYCTLPDCVGGCPAGSECLQFNDAALTTGCLLLCNGEAECDAVRPDAFCLPVPGAPFFGVCLTDCRDDILDCAPRNGSMWCNRGTGQCEPTPMQSAGTPVGAACVSNADCGNGQVCMGEIGWGLPGGMCTRVCQGLPEATACSAGETCQPLAGIGLCFRNCVGGACPNRAGAACGTLDPSWLTTGCIPQ